MEALVAISLLVFLVALVLRNAGRRKLVIKSPRLGMINLLDDPAAQLLAEDHNALVPLFGNPVKMQGDIPACDLLFIYCELDSSGEARNSTVLLQEIVEASGAKIVVIASENAEDRYRAIAKRSQGVNLVMALDRKGAAFSRFFSLLFSEMFKGTPMPVAWNKLAPQISGHEHVDCPETYCIMGAGQLVFK